MCDRSDCDYLEVSHHDETSGTDPASGESGHVENAVLVSLYDVSVTQEADQHHWRNRREARVIFELCW